MNNMIRLTVHINGATNAPHIFDAEPGKSLSEYTRKLGNILVASKSPITGKVDDKDKIDVNADLVGYTDMTIYVNAQPHSYHNFFFPFLWADSSKSANREDFSRCLSPAWKPDVIAPDTNLEPLSDADFIEKYNTYHYFNQAAKNAIYSNNEKNAIVWNYQYDMSQSTDSDWLNSVKTSNNKAQYVITKEVEEYENDKKKIIYKNYRLKVNGIRLKLFNTGIGILIFELENYEHPEISDITWINDYGRRIYAPFTEEVCGKCNKCDNTEQGKAKSCDSHIKCGQCADSVSLEYDGTKCTGCLMQKTKDYTDTLLIKPIKHLFTNGEYSITTSRKNTNKTTRYIEPIIDDRMFTACYYVNAPLIEEMRKWHNGDYAYIHEAYDKPLGGANDASKKADPKKYNLASILYELVYVDGNGITCQSRKKLKEMLGNNHIYDRWLEYGTITGISEYSMISITNDTADYLARNFLTEYIELMILALAQRASLLNFERMISNCTLKKDKIRTINKSFLLFQSQLLLQEVTPQQQGIELYQMLLENMFIKKQTEDIEKQINSLFAQKTSENEAHENLILFLIALCGAADVLNRLIRLFVADTLPRLHLGLGFFFVAIIIYSIYRKK